MGAQSRLGVYDYAAVMLPQFRFNLDSLGDIFMESQGLIEPAKTICFLAERVHISTCGLY